MLNILYKLFRKIANFNIFIKEVIINNEYKIMEELNLLLKICNQSVNHLLHNLKVQIFNLYYLCFLYLLYSLLGL